MRLQMALDMLHRKIEEWTEKAFIAPEVSEPKIEAFLEFGSDLVAHLHEVAGQLEIVDEEAMVPETDAAGPELCDEIAELFLDEWAHIDFTERPPGAQIDELGEVMDAIAEVLDAPPEDCEMELEEATEMLDDYLAGVM